MLDLNAIAAEPYEQRGIIHSEMALIIRTVRELGIEVFLESGRARGQSTYMLSKYLPEVAIYSVEARRDADAEFGRQRCEHLPNVTLLWGDGRQILPRFAEEAAPKRTAVLCDGPKGFLALAVIEKCMRFPHVVAGFIHDMRRTDHDAPSPYRAAAAAVFPGATFSDDPSLVAELAWMDAKVVAANGPCGPEWEAKHGSYGPTVGMFLKK